MEAQQEAEQKVPLEVRRRSAAITLAICTGGWLVPGAGHVALGRWVRGLMFFVSVMVMFGLGIAMDGKLYDLNFEQPLHLFAFFANVGAGAPYMIAQWLGWGMGMLTSVTYDYGTTYLWVAGLSNFLIVLDVFDIAQGRKS